MSGEKPWTPEPVELDHAQRNQLRGAVFDAWRNSEHVDQIGALGLMLVMDMSDAAIQAVLDTYAQIVHSIESPDLGRGGAS